MSQDDGLVALLATDLNQHFKRLVLTYQHRLYGFMLRQTGSTQDAEDITEEAFMRAYYALWENWENALLWRDSKRH